MRALLASIVLASGVALAQETEEPAPDPVAGLLTALEPQLAESFFRSMGSRVMQSLMRSGLSPADSEQVARQYAADIASCGTTMITEEAARQSISIAELFTRFFAAMQAGEWNRPEVTARLSEVVDVNSATTGLFPCIAAATQRAGLSYEEEGEATRNEVFPDEP